LQYLFYTSFNLFSHEALNLPYSRKNNNLIYIKMKKLILSAMMLTGVIAFAQEQPAKQTTTQPTQTQQPAQNDQVKPSQPTQTQPDAKQAATSQSTSTSTSTQRKSEATIKEQKPASDRKSEPARKS
jgi:hypothetical protein